MNPLILLGGEFSVLLSFHLLFFLYSAPFLFIGFDTEPFIAHVPKYPENDEKDNDCDNNPNRVLYGVADEIEDEYHDGAQVCVC